MNNNLLKNAITDTIAVNKTLICTRVGNEGEHTKPLMIASHENALTRMAHLKDRFKSTRIQKMAERIYE